MKHYRYPFRGEFRNPVCISNPKDVVDKVKLREEVKAATQEYLNSGKRIEMIPPGPTAKVLSVGLKCLGNELSFGKGELYEAPDVYAEMEMELNKQLMESEL